MKTTTRGAELRLDLAVELSDLVRAFLREASLAEGAPLATARHLTDGAALVWMALCRHQGGGGRARLSALARNSEIIVRISVTGHDRFMRIMPALFDGLPDDLGFSYRERGIDGWEVTLHTSLEPFSPAVHGPEEEEEEAQGAEEAFQIDLPRQEDCAAIARCFLQVYGRRYVHAEVFSPRRYWAKVQSGELIPVIARDARGDVVGHVALEREEGAAIAERGQAVVLPSYRGRHLLESMTERLSAQAEEIGLTGIFAQPVTIHTFSQRNDDRAGMPVCAAMLGMLPENVLPKGLSIPTRGQRQSLLIAFRFLQSPGERPIHAPEAYRDIISQIMARLGAPARFAEASDGASGGAAPESVIQVKMEGLGAATIRIDAIGARIDTELKQAFRDIIGLGAEYVRLSAPLRDPGVARLAETARALGFYFCGVGPAFLAGDDALLLQYARRPIDVSKLQLFADHARALVGFIEQDRLSVGAASGQ